jgi:cytidine deaminase
MLSGEITHVAVAIAAKHNGTPCGACRQVISEFASPDCQIIIMNLTTNSVREYSLRELLPDAFSGHSLNSQG